MPISPIDFPTFKGLQFNDLTNPYLSRCLALSSCVGLRFPLFFHSSSSVFGWPLQVSHCFCFCIVLIAKKENEND